MQKEIKELIAQRDALDKRIKEATQTARAEALNTCRELIQEFNFNPVELGIKKFIRSGRAIAPKYIGPQGQTWAGRGRKPVWLQQAELEGKTREDFRIKPFTNE